jgi:hypothetical protein
MFTRIRLVALSLALAAPMCLPSLAQAGFRFP